MAIPRPGVGGTMESRRGDLGILESGTLSGIQSQTVSFSDLSVMSHHIQSQSRLHPLSSPPNLTAMFPAFLAALSRATMEHGGGAKTRLSRSFLFGNTLL